MTYRDFQKNLRETGHYATPAENRPKMARPGAYTSWRYAATILSVVRRCTWQHLRGRFNEDVWAKACFAAVTFAERMGTEVTFEGFEQRAAHDGPVVYTSNHMSTLETMVFPTTLLTFSRLSIILKKSLADIPFVGDAVCAVGAIAVTRKNARQDLKTVLDEGCKRIADGYSVLLFPQGTRQTEFDGKQFNSLGSKLAERAGVPVVPLAVKTDFLQTGKIVKDFGHVDPSRPIRFACGPVLPAALGARKTLEQSIAFIAQKLREWDMPVVSHD